MRNCGAFLFGSLLIAMGSMAQEPDLSRLKSDREKIKAWMDYCEALRINQQAVKGNYILLEHAAIKGLQLTRPGDAEDRGSHGLWPQL